MAAKKLLASEGYDPQFGARPLKRAVQEHILNPLSMRLLEGEFKPGDRIKVTTKDDALIESGLLGPVVLEAAQQIELDH